MPDGGITQGSNSTSSSSNVSSESDSDSSSSVNDTFSNSTASRRNSGAQVSVSGIKKNNAESLRSRNKNIVDENVQYRQEWDSSSN